MGRIRRFLLISNNHREYILLELVGIVDNHFVMDSPDVTFELFGIELDGAHSMRVKFL